MKQKQDAIHIQTEEPNYEGLPDMDYNQTYTVYRSTSENTTEDIPIPLGSPVTITTYKDINLYYDLLTGRAVTGIFYLLNKMPIDWYFKKQATIETATYISEFVLARITTDQIIAL